MEFGHLPFRRATFEDYVGEAARAASGRSMARDCGRSDRATAAALEPDYVVLGGGNSKKVVDLPRNVRLGANENAFAGAFRLWDPAMGAPRSLPAASRSQAQGRVGRIDEFSTLRSSNEGEALHQTRKDDRMQKLTPCLWFDTEGEDAANFYTSVFPNSKIRDVARYGSAGPRAEGRYDRQLRAGRAGVRGPERRARVHVQRSPLVPGQLRHQDEVDAYWSKLSEGGEEGPCGWLKDKFGLSWQIVPTALPELLQRPRPGEGTARHGRRC